MPLGVGGVDGARRAFHADPSATRAEVAMETVLGMLLVGGLLVGVYWAGTAHRRAHPVPLLPQPLRPRVGEGPAAAATERAVARAEGIAGIGRNDERRCAH
jgi:hypothetical protein